ncbi:sulfate/molybdate ABC transporter ATP-binding protein [Acinetobacter sp.]|mgnify:FL=1|uniref:sulfate/molybdate ABC transporter ATP-binding protein n=1 Tax=Acinetobacter sp. TaxID=472 RepID=UPI00388D8B47
MSIQVKNIEKHFGAFHALNNISLDFPDGQLVALLGPSGCGKTTLLRIIAGLESADGGQVILEGEDATDVHVRERQVGFVFQHYALFRHMTVFDNIAFGLRVRPRSTRPSEVEIKKRVTRLLDLVQLGFLADRFPAQLSGGQRQRIALARALAVEPRVLLLDEPFGALDAKVRKELRRWLRTLHDELHITSIFVTHDQEEALEVADQIIVMNKGNVEQIGSPREVYEKPATPFVFDFLGQANRFEGQNQQGIIHLGEDRIKLPQVKNAPQGEIIAFARPNELSIHATPQQNAIQATFLREIWIAGKVLAELQDRQGNLIEISLNSEEAKLHQFKPNQTVWLSPSALHLFANDVA